MTADQLSYYMASKGLSIDQMASRCGVSVSTVKKWLKDTKGIPVAIDRIIELEERAERLDERIQDLEWELEKMGVKL